MKPVYIIGHKNPDMDSLAASIAYKVFKQTTGEDIYIAAAASEPAPELQEILQFLEWEVPQVVENVSTNVGDLLSERDLVTIEPDTTLMEIGNILKHREIKTLAVVDEKNKFLGLITIGDIAKIYMENLGSGLNIENSPAIISEILAQRAFDIMKTRGVRLFENRELWHEAKRQMLESRYRNYPVVDEENCYLGMISRYDLLKMTRKKVILVDHNEKKQAVDGIEEAEILEIIDHHRLGDLQTLSPIYFHNEPVGSTCTLIAEFFFTHKVNLPSRLAALLLTGIMSDTMLFKSPTTTVKDKRIVSALENISDLDAIHWGKEVFTRIHKAEQLTNEEIVVHDLKEYVRGEQTFAIAQMETMDFNWLRERNKELVLCMEALCAEKGYGLMCLMITNIFEEGTVMLVAGENSDLIEEAFAHEKTEAGIFLRGVLSRKKQVVPVIYENLRKNLIMGY